MNPRQAKIDRIVQIDPDFRAFVSKTCRSGNGRFYGAGGLHIPTVTYETLLERPGKISALSDGRHSALVTWDVWPPGIWISTEYLAPVKPVPQPAPQPKPQA